MPETKVVWERESDRDLARSLGQVPNSVMHTVKNDEKVKETLDNGKPVYFTLKSERLYASTESGEKLTKEHNFKGIPDATIIAFQDKANQVTLELTKESQDNLKDYRQERTRGR